MTRDSGLDPILHPWMARNAPPAPDDLLPRVMREVEIMSQRTATWPRWLMITHSTTLVAVAAGVALLAIVMGAYFASDRSASIGTNATPTPIPTASTAVAPTTVIELIDANIAAWNAHDGDAAVGFYTTDASLRIAVGSPTWTETYDGQAQIKATVDERAGVDFTVTRTGIVLAKPWSADAFYAGTALRYTSSIGGGYGVAVYRIADMRIQSQWNILLSATAPDSVVQTPLIETALISRVLTAWGSGDGELAASYYTSDADVPTSADVRLAIGASDFTEEYVGEAAIAQTVTLRSAFSFEVRQEGAALKYGDFILFPAIWGSTQDAGEMFVIFQLNPDHTQIVHQWGFGS